MADGRDGVNDPNTGLPERFERLTRRARGYSAFERFWRAALPPLSLLGLFTALSLLDLWVALPAFLHLLALLAFVAGIAYLVWRGWRRFTPVGRDEALTRIERGNRLTDAPLRSLDDRLPESLDDPLTARLWQRHRERTLASLGVLKLPLPRSPWPRLDPWGLRALVLLLLVVGLAAAGRQAPDRLADAFVPRFGGPTEAAEPLKVDVWLTPPAFTGLPPVTLADGDPRAEVAVPAGTAAILQVQGSGANDATLGYGGDGLDGTALGAAGQEARFTLERTGDIVVANGGEPVRRLRVMITPDAPPSVAFASPPSETARESLQIAYDAKDDYGVKNLALILRAPDGGKEEILPLATPARGPKEVRGRTFQNFARHPRAGLPTLLQLEARDARDQPGRSEVVLVTLPEKVFTHPLARAIIAERKGLAETGSVRQSVADALDGLAEGPLAAEQPTTVPLTLGVAADRLRDDADGAERASIMDMLYDLALFIEEGDLSVAERDLRQAQEALEQALAEGADEAELEQLMQELEQAMQAYLDELSEQMQQALQNADPGDMQPVPEGAQTVDRDQLQQMLDQAREMMRTGAREAAQEMLAQLRDMLENLQAGVPQMQAGPQQQALQDLQRMIELQQGLMDQTFQQQQNGTGQQQGQQGQQGQGQQGQQGQGQQGGGQQRPGGQGQAGLTGSAAEQEGLRRALGEMMRRLGEAGAEIPGALGQSELRMRDARDALGQGQPGQALGPQGEALDLMRQAGQAMVESMQQQGQGMAQGQPGQGQGPGMPGQGRDLLGRELPGGYGLNGDDVDVPTEAELGRAREVLDEIRRRSGENNRPKAERDYYDRLLDRF